MSGIEIAGLVFGIVPIAVEALESYSFVRDKLQTCRHYSDEVEEVAARLSSARANFNNEIQLLRRCLRNKERTQELDADLKDALDESYRSCIKTIDRTKKVLEKMTLEMAKFDELLAKKSQGQCIKQLRHVIKITFNESKYERLLNRLRDRNNELHDFRLQIKDLKQPETTSSGICLQYKPLPDRFLRIQATSRQLHAALHEVWRCNDSQQQEHHAKLCLDVEVAAEDIRLDLAMSCQDRHSEPSCRASYPMMQPHIWLYVQSAIVTIQNASEIQPSKRLHVSQPRDSSHAAGGSKNAKRKASPDFSAKKTRKRNSKNVQWATLPSEAFERTPPSHYSEEADADLRRTKNICEILKKSNQSRLLSHERRCMGFLQDSCLYKHTFYFRTDLSRPEFIEDSGHAVIAFDEVLKQDVNGIVKVADQLRLAHKLATSVLQYNETPWLSNNWRLSDMKYLGTKSVVDATSLRTLHLSSKISHKLDGPRMEGITLAQDAVTNEVRHGITNPMLFCLGAALLEIAHWSTIESKMIEEDEGNPVLTVRRLERDRSIPLGIEYLSIAKRCLWCDFGFGNQLSEEALQSAVYTNVWELEGLISKFARLGIQ